MSVQCELKGKRIERVSFLPVMINKQAQPGLVDRTDHDFEEIVEYMRRISASQGFSTDFRVEGDEVAISLM